MLACLRRGSKFCCADTEKLQCLAVAYPGIFFRGGGVQQIQLRTEDREDGDLGAVAP